jgi:serine/threonine-protein kinase RsbT
MGDPTRVPIRSEHDIVVARQSGRLVATAVGFSGSALTLIATAISEIARNILTYADRGELELCPLEDGFRRGIEVIARDQGPGIPDIERAMQDGYTTGRGLGLGLPGARRLMDEFTLVSTVGEGTTVVMRKWVR